MQIFKINKNLRIECEWKKTRNAFKHEATLLDNNNWEIDKTKICYHNRTWESFEFESVIEQLLGKTKILTERQKTNFLKRASGDSNKKTASQFNMIAGIATLGNLFCPEQKDANNWKTRMLKAGLENKGLIMPDEWDSLDEDDKTARLDAVIGELAKKEIIV